MMAHGYCLGWRQPLVGLHIAVNCAIALAYFSIPAMLWRLAHKRRDLPYVVLFWCFGLFIISCGTGHVMDILTLWFPIYYVKLAVDTVTAITSIGTAALTWPTYQAVLKNRHLIRQRLQAAIDDLQRHDLVLQKEKETAQWAAETARLQAVVVELQDLCRSLDP